MGIGTCSQESIVDIVNVNVDSLRRGCAVDKVQNSCDACSAIKEHILGRSAGYSKGKTDSKSGRVASRFLERCFAIKTGGSTASWHYIL